jgi:hypothetical protein
MGNWPALYVGVPLNHVSRASQGFITSTYFGNIVCKMKGAISYSKVLIFSLSARAKTVTMFVNVMVAQRGLRFGWMIVGHQGGWKTQIL